MKNLAEWSWAEDVVYACGCGATFAARRWRWVDAESEPAIASSIRRDGIIVGECPACHTAAVGLGAWLELRPAVEEATLILCPHQRAEVVELLREHLRVLSLRPSFARAWMLQPKLVFHGGAVTLDTAKEPPPVVPAAGETPTWAPIPPASEIEWAASGELDLIDGVVVVRLHLNDSTAQVWSEALVEARPILLRGFGYPLLGVRLVANYLGERAVIDGLIDVGDVEAHEIFARLAQGFALTLTIYGQRGRAALVREIEAPGCERNVALCLESASSLLASGDFGADAFLEACGQLAVLGVGERLEPAPVVMASGDHRELRTAAEAWEALEHLDRASSRENLTRLLEIDGLALSEYEEIRRAVLSAAVEFGLTPASRFWRRILIPEVGPNPEAIVQRLASTRARGQGGALSPEAALENWYRMKELADRKRVACPKALTDALAAGAAGKSSRPLGRRRSKQPPMVASGFIGETVVSPAPTPPSPSSGRSRLAQATDVLEGVPTLEELNGVILSMEKFDADEILALLPALAELGSSVTPAMLERLRSPRREVRQSAAILLGLARDGRALEHLCKGLLSEDTNVWRDIARALGNFGPRAVGPLCELVKRVDLGRRDHAANRVARALAEVVLSDGDIRGGPGRHAVEALVDVHDRSIASSATHALATLGDVNSAGEEIRGERPLAEDTAVRGFARRAYEAITTPELDILVEDDFEFEEVR